MHAALVRFRDIRTTLSRRIWLTSLSAYKWRNAGPRIRDRGLWSSHMILAASGRTTAAPAPQAPRAPCRLNERAHMRCSRHLVAMQLLHLDLSIPRVCYYPSGHRISWNACSLRASQGRYKRFSLTCLWCEVKMSARSRFADGVIRLPLQMRTTWNKTFLRNCCKEGGHPV